MAWALAQCGIARFPAATATSRSIRSSNRVRSSISCSRIAAFRSVFLPQQWPRRRLEAAWWKERKCCISCWNESLESTAEAINNNEPPNPAAYSSQNSPPPEPEPQTSSSSSRNQHFWWHRLRKLDFSKWILKGSSEDERLWKVPWTGQTIFQVMFLWFAAFWLVGSWIVPIAAHMVGFSKDSLTYRGQALYSLVTDIAEGTVGLGILHGCLSRFQPLPGEEDWFPVKFKGHQWCLDACLGCLIFPLVNRLSQINLDLLPFPAPFTTSSQVEQSIMAKDPVATVLYAIVVAVCAPIWEEVIFRGFLLPSLTRYLPLWSSILISALAFALAHFSMQRLLPLTFLGLVMGIVFVRNRNLLASILLHSLWNVSVFMDLLGC